MGQVFAAILVAGHLGTVISVANYSFSFIKLSRLLKGSGGVRCDRRSGLD